ncbi:MAG: endonuclease domain-containing protein [Prevotella sp.]
MPEHKINQSGMKFLRRRLRNNSTPAECALWKLIKGKHIEGLGFRRQYSVDKYIIDFYCPELKLGIELDGDCHYYGGAKEHDIERENFLLHQYGIRFLRFENKVVFEQPQSIVNKIIEFKNTQ